MYFIVKMVIFQPAPSVCQEVKIIVTPPHCLLHRFYGATEGNGALVNVCRTVFLTGDDDNVAGAEMGWKSRAVAKRAWDMCEAKIEQRMQSRNSQVGGAFLEEVFS